MKKRRFELIGLILACCPLAASIVLVSVSFIDHRFAAAIAVDKLILLTAVLSPVVYVAGAVISIIALFKSRKKTTALTAVVLNTALLVVHLYFSKPVLMEFEFVI